jgi:hypothetical protein
MKLRDRPALMPMAAFTMERSALFTCVKISPSPRPPRTGQLAAPRSRSSPSTLHTAKLHNMWVQNGASSTR